MFIFPAILESVKSRKDKSLSVTLGTQEMAPDNAAKLMSLNQQYLYVMFKPDVITTQEKDVMESIEASEDDSKKSQSQRMRAVLYLLFKKNSEGFDDFSKYYEFKMNKMIDLIKTKL